MHTLRQKLDYVQYEILGTRFTPEHDSRTGHLDYMNSSADCRGNNLLDSLSSAEKYRLYPHLEAVQLALDHAVYEPGQSQKYAYFPAGVVFSLQCTLVNGDAGETAVVGNEGMVGTSLIMGGNSTLGRAVVKRAGLGYRVKAHAIQQEFDRAGTLMQIVLRYTQALITQTSQMAACNRHHSIDQRLARRLLIGLDHTPQGELLMTQEVIAHMLGVRREGVTQAAMRLQEDGLIRYARGHIVVADRRQLEKRSCECYSVVKREYARLLPSEDSQPADRRQSLSSA